MPDSEPHEAVEEADVEIGRELASNRHHPAVKAAGFASKIGDQEPLYAISAALLLVGIVTRERRLVGSATTMLAAVAAADLAKSAVKRSVSRTRPHVLLDEQRYDTHVGGSDQKSEQSFPSGHMAGTVAAARALSRNFPAAGAAAGLAAIGMGVSRVAKGAHWPLDIVAGAIIGFAAEALSTTIVKVIVERCAEIIPRQWRPVITR